MKNEAAVELGRRGGQARTRNLTSEELSAIGKLGAKARWKKDEDEPVRAGFRYPKRWPKAQRQKAIMKGKEEKRDGTDHN